MSFCIFTPRLLCRMNSWEKCKENGNWFLVDFYCFLYLSRSAWRCSVKITSSCWPLRIPCAAYRLRLGETIHGAGEWRRARRLRWGRLLGQRPELFLRQRPRFWLANGVGWVPVVSAPARPSVPELFLVESRLHLQKIFVIFRDINKPSFYWILLDKIFSLKIRCKKKDILKIFIKFFIYLL